MVIVSEGVVAGGIVGPLGEARPSVVESSEYDGVVGSIGAWIGPWIYSCGGVSWGLFGFCSTCVVSSCSCNVDGEGWPVSDDDGACWHHGHIRNGSSSMPICFLHIWCTRAGHVGMRSVRLFVACLCLHKLRINLWLVFRS